MQGHKLRKLIVASVSTAVLLLTILLSVMVYQMFALRVKRKQIEALENEIAYLEQEKSSTESEIDLWLSKWKIEERALELGWLHGTDK